METGRPNQTVYTFEQADRTRLDVWTRDYSEAEAYARLHGLLLIENEYTWEDSNLLEDYSNNGEKDGGQGGYDAKMVDRSECACMD